MKKIYNTHLLVFLITFVLTLAAFTAKMWLVAGILALVTYLIRRRYRNISRKARLASSMKLVDMYNQLKRANIEDEKTLDADEVAQNRGERFGDFMCEVSEHIEKWPEDRSPEILEFRSLYNQWMLD